MTQQGFGDQTHKRQASIDTYNIQMLDTNSLLPVGLFNIGVHPLRLLYPQGPWGGILIL